MAHTGLDTFFSLYRNEVSELIAETQKHGDPYLAAKAIGITTRSWVTEFLNYAGGNADIVEAQLDLELAIEKGTNNRPHYAKQRFLAELALEASVVKAVASQEWYTKSFFDSERSSDPVFADAWDEAHDAAVDRLRLEAWRRAVDGVDEPVVYKGQYCYQVDEASGKREQVVVRKHSDAMLQMLLKRYDPGFGDRIEVDQTTKVKSDGLDLSPETLASMSDDELKILRKFIDLQPDVSKDEPGSDQS